MRRNSIASALLCLLSIISVSLANAQQCDTVLTATGRNYMRQLSASDQAAWYYKHVCEGSALDINGNYTDESKDLWSQAKTQLGLSYSQQKTYCSTEASRYANYTYSSLDTSTVMASSTAAWVKCIELTRKGVVITPTITPRVVTFAIQRAGKTNGIINGVNASLGITCVATLRDKAGVTSQVDLSDNKLDHDMKLAEVDTMTVLCQRQFARDNAQATFYPVGDITVSTSEGPLTIELDADTLGKELWASQVVARMTGQDQEIAALRAALNVTDAYARSPRKVMPAIPGVGYIQSNLQGKAMPGPHSNGWYSSNEEAPCDPEMVMVASTVGGGPALGVRCATLMTVP
jgi:hypothetical protein